MSHLLTAECSITRNISSPWKGGEKKRRLPNRMRLLLPPDAGPYCGHMLRASSVVSHGVYPWQNGCTPVPPPPFVHHTTFAALLNDRSRRPQQKNSSCSTRFILRISKLQTSSYRMPVTCIYSRRNMKSDLTQVIDGSYMLPNVPPSAFVVVFFRHF